MPSVTASAIPPSTAVRTTLTWTKVSRDDDDDDAVFSSSTYKSVHRRPRRSRPRDFDYGYASHGFSQIHGGAFDPQGDLSSAFLFGVRGGSSIDDRIQIGIGVDWSRRSDERSQVLSSEDLPGGGATERRLELARSTSDLLPIMGFVQFAPFDNNDFTPYVGIGGGYEVLFVSADDFETGQEFDATFGGWGWQAWAGASFHLSGNTNLTGEFFTNSAELARDVTDDNSGRTVREIVDMDGVGFRAGLNWGF